MRVLLVNTLYPPTVVGGAELSVALLARALVAHGVEVAVATLHGKGETREDLVDGVRVHALPLRNLYWPFEAGARRGWRGVWHGLDSFNPRAVRDLSRIIKREKPDLVHTNNLTGFSAAVWLAAWRRGLPIVHTLRDYYLLCPRTTMYRRGRTCQATCAACTAYAWPRQLLSHLPSTVVGISVTGRRTLTTT